ncbi:MAG: dephospho-CoA kinase [Nitrospirota bacterium]
MLVVGLTGNYGMGKSAVLALFGKYGAAVLDSDEVVHSLLSEQEVLDKIRRLFGSAVFFEDGTLNRGRLAEIVFREDALRHSLEEILHPLVFRRIDGFLQENYGKCGIAVIEVPLLFEGGYEKRFDRTITVFTDAETALLRLAAVGIGREDADRRLKTQLSIEEKKKRSDYVIDNRADLKTTETHVAAIYKKLVEEVGDGNNQRDRKSH